MNNKTILIVEDNQEVLLLNKKVLERKGFLVLAAQTLAEARSYLGTQPIHLIILDIRLPDGNGVDFCTEIRRRISVPILMLSSLKEQKDIVGGLMAGGDDYMTKPYRLEELYARILSLLRREQMFEKQLNQQKVMTSIERGPLKLETVQGRAYLNGVDVGLTPKEFSLLLLLVQNEGTALSSRFIYEKVWGVESNDDIRAVWTHISKLRSKLGIGVDTPINITAERNKGYLFTASQVV